MVSGKKTANTIEEEVVGGNDTYDDAEEANVESSRNNDSGLAPPPMNSDMMTTATSPPLPNVDQDGDEDDQPKNESNNNTRSVSSPQTKKGNDNSKDDGHNDEEEAVVETTKVKQDTASTPSKKMTRRYPKAFYCTETNKLLKDPVVKPDGYSYDRSTIDETCNVVVYPNRALKKVMEEMKPLYGDSMRNKLQRVDKSLRDNFKKIKSKSIIFRSSSDFRPLPDSYYCPITQDLLRDPVIDVEGNTYSRKAIAKWITKTGTSPLTRSTLQISELYPNRAMMLLLLDEENKDEQLMHPSVRRWAKENEEEDERDVENATRPLPPPSLSELPPDDGYHTIRVDYSNHNQVHTQDNRANPRPLFAVPTEDGDYVINGVGYHRNTQGSSDNLINWRCSNRKEACETAGEVMCLFFIALLLFSGAALVYGFWLVVTLCCVGLCLTACSYCIDDDEDEENDGGRGDNSSGEPLAINGIAMTSNNNDRNHDGGELASGGDTVGNGAVGGGGDVAGGGGGGGGGGDLVGGGGGGGDWVGGGGGGDWLGGFNLF